MEKYIFEWERPLAEGHYVQAVIELVKNQRGVTFVEIQNMLSQAIQTKGDMALCLSQYPNIILWPNVSQQFLTIMGEVLNSQDIEFTTTSLLTYAFDGGVPNMPIAKRLRNYKDPHWIPVVFNPKKSQKNTSRKKRK